MCRIYDISYMYTHHMYIYIYILSIYIYIYYSTYLSFSHCTTQFYHPFVFRIPASWGAVTWNKQPILSSIPSEFARPYARLRFTEGEKHIDSGWAKGWGEAKTLTKGVKELQRNTGFGKCRILMHFGHPQYLGDVQLGHLPVIACNRLGN